ncbi:aspartate/glutamate racemase family protein [Patulibacter defluvii]|uniref:aspartate/glutamate racemase family protein n=1 Tax=Patulibacter defluvii TaxID=3095358 RepID=UPI002A752D54|nr:aspartate/glutamate racemase family protein [Patulibacter sp. DM4]
MPKILVVNSNASREATSAIEQACASLAGDGLALDFATAGGGAEGIDTLLDMTIAAVETARVVAAQRDRYDAYVVACGVDPGLDAARQVTDKPVVGIAEAALLYTWPLGLRYSLLTTGRASVAYLDQLVRTKGLDARLASIATVEATTTGMMGDDGDGLYDAFLAVAREQIEERLAEVLVVTGSIMTPLARRLEADTGVPVVSGLPCAVTLAASLVRLGLRTSHRYSYATPVKVDRLLGYDDLAPVYSAPQNIP